MRSEVVAFDYSGRPSSRTVAPPDRVFAGSLRSEDIGLILGLQAKVNAYENSKTGHCKKSQLWRCRVRRTPTGEVLGEASSASESIEY